MKPGWKTTEFWLTLLTALPGIAVTAGLIPTADRTMLDSAASKIAAGLLAAITVAKYVHSRALVKGAPPASLVILAILATAGGWFAAPTLWGGQNHFQNYLDPVFASSDAIAAGLRPMELPAVARALELKMTGVAVAIALIGFLFAWWFYIRRPQAPEALAEDLPIAYKLLINKYYVDEIYAFLFVRPLIWISTNALWRAVDDGVIDGTVNGVASLARSVGARVRTMQSGNERSYATWIVVGAVIVTGFFFWWVR